MEIRYQIYLMKGKTERPYVWKERGDKVRRGLFTTVEEAYDKMNESEVAEWGRDRGYEFMGIREIHTQTINRITRSQPKDYVRKYRLNKPKKLDEVLIND